MTKRLIRAIIKFFHVTTMWCDVINVCRWCIDSTHQTLSTPRFTRQLYTPNPLPSGSAIQPVPFPMPINHLTACMFRTVHAYSCKGSTTRIRTWNQSLMRQVCYSCNEPVCFFTVCNCALSCTFSARRVTISFACISTCSRNLRFSSRTASSSLRC